MTDSLSKVLVEAPLGLTRNGNVRRPRNYQKKAKVLTESSVASITSDDWTLPSLDPSPSKSNPKSTPKSESKAPSHGGQWKKFMVGFDVHGDQQDPDVNEAFFRHMELFQPDIRIMGGDLWDFRPLRNGANAEERQESMTQDYLAGLRWLDRFRPQHFLLGNHDIRMWDWAWSKRGVEQDFAKGKVEHIEEVVRGIRCQMYPYHIKEGVLEIGKLKVAHGFYAGVNCARQMAADYGCIIFGHNHTIQVQCVPGIERKAARCCGALVKIIMPYNERSPSTLRHANGWAYGMVNERTGAYHLFQAEEVCGVWMVGSDIVEL